MTRKSLNIFALLVAIVAGFALTACNSSDEPSVMSFTNMAVYKGSTASTSSFTVYTNDAQSSTIDLITSSPFTTTAPNIGDRVVIVYQFTDGTDLSNLPNPAPVNLLAAYKVFNGNLSITEQADTINLNTHGIYMTSLWRTGPYLNLQATQQTAIMPVYSLILDNSTLDREVPVAYLLTSESPVGGTPLYESYASFDISSLIDHYSGLEVHLSNTRRPTENQITFDFKATN